MQLNTIIYVCTRSVPWELDKKDIKIISKHQKEPINVIIKKLWEAASI